MIASGIPTISRLVRNGAGGVNKDSIPVREDLNGEVVGYLVNGTTVRIVDPTYPGISRYRKIYNGTTWVLFDIHGFDMVKGQDGWCELTGHLVEVEPVPTPEPNPTPIPESIILVTGINFTADGIKLTVRM